MDLIEIDMSILLYVIYIYYFFILLFVILMLSEINKSFIMWLFFQENVIILRHGPRTSTVDFQYAIYAENYEINDFVTLIVKTFE